MNGTIIKGIGGFYYVKAADNNVYECRARGIFRKEHIKPMIGDRVEISLQGEGGTVVRIFERKTRLLRPPVANIDMMLLVVAAASPDPSLALIDKMLINARQNGIDAVLCLNKSDLARRTDVEEIYSGAGYRVIRASAVEKTGTDELSRLLCGKVTAFAGLSGVGKSTLLSIITGRTLETGAVSEKIMRGRHTTRHVELFPLPNGGFVLDTPGFSSLETLGIEPEELQEYFPEMDGAAQKCRFRGCAHISEPDCEVKRRLGAGEIAPSRYESYKEIYKKLKAKRSR